jgi:hypothetical protein
LTRIVNISEIDEDRRLQQTLDPLEIEATKLIPLRRQDQGIATLGHIIGILAEFNIRENMSGFFHGGRIVGLDLCPLLEKGLNDDDGRGFPYIIRIRFKGETSNLAT